MIPQTTNGEMKTGSMDKSARYFNYLRTLADLTAIASIMAVQVISGLFDTRFNRDIFERTLMSFGRSDVYTRHIFGLIPEITAIKLILYFNL